jgi:hypothetical protein
MPTDVWRPGMPEDARLRIESSVFVTAYVLYTLAAIDRMTGERDETVVSRALSHVEAMQCSPGYWYWRRAGDQGRSPSFPPVADDTACATLALRTHRRPVVNPAPLLTSRDAAGRFYTWLVRRRPRHVRLLPAALRLPPATQFTATVNWQAYYAELDDVDAVVNVNVIAALGERPETRAAVAFIERIVEKHREGDADKWHVGTPPFYYAVARAVEARALRPSAMTEMVAERAMESLPDLDTPTDLAHAACAALMLGRRSPEVSAAVERLEKAQRPDGSWEPGPLYTGLLKAEHAWWFAESAPLTTALCAEALARLGATQRTR